MTARIRRNGRLSVGLCCVSLVLLLYLGAYKALGQIPLVTQTAESTVGFSESSYTIGRGQTAEIVVALNTPSQQDVTIYYATSDDTGKAGVDYRETSGSLTIPSRALSQAFTVPTMLHSIGQPFVTMSIALSSPSNAKIGSSTTKMHILSSPNDQNCQGQ